MKEYKFAWTPLIVVGMLVRVFFVIFVHPITLDVAISSFSQDISQNFISVFDGALVSYGDNKFNLNYGPLMAIVLLPLTSLGVFIDSLLGTSDVFSVFGFRITILMVDFIGLLIAMKLVPGREKLAIVIYWLSPISLLITYWYGQLEIIPVVLMMAVFSALKKNKTRLSGILLGLCIVAKLVTLLLIPFFIIYMWQNRRFRADILSFLLSVASVIFICLIPFALLSPGARESFGSAIFPIEISSLAIRLPNQVVIYVIPLAYMLMLYSLWRIRRSNFDVFIYVVGISIILLVIVTTITPGYYLWILPFLLLYVARTTRIGRVLVNLFLLLVLMMFISVSTDVIVSIGSYIIRVDYFLSGGADVASFLMTAVVAGGLILVMRMFVEGVQFNSYFRVSRRPLVLGIAGDTGSGKGKLANSLLNIFGSHSVTMIFGDAYQKWERAAPMWQVISHLNPKATDLSAMTRDVIAVITGETVFRRQYNHIVGRFMSPSPIKPNDIVVVAGLHALFQPQLREKLDVKIFLEVDNDLREFRKLREGLITGVGELNEEKDLVSMRKAESIEHITPQIHHADLIFSLLPVNSRHLFLHSQAGTIPLKLRVRMRDALYYESIIRVLIGICGLQLDWEISDEGRSLDFTVEGDVAADDINLAANSIMPRISDFVGIIPAWENGMIGIMQLITLAHVEQTLRKRILE